MGNPKYKYIYGPVSSWRLGRSLGIDPISSAEKICSFDCIYCQAGKTKTLTAERKVFVSTPELISEIRHVPAVSLDFITFAGNGEPTLAKNLGEMIREIRKIRSEKIAVITNASLIDRADVQSELSLADLVVAKLDAGSAQVFGAVNQPSAGIVLLNIFKGLKSFREHFKGRLALQVMFVEGNKPLAGEIAKMALQIKPDEVEVNTPLRASTEKPLASVEIEGITKIFRETCVNIPVRSVYETERKKSSPFCRDSTERRRGREMHG